MTRGERKMIARQCVCVGLAWCAMCCGGVLINGSISYCSNRCHLSAAGPGRPAAALVNVHESLKTLEHTWAATHQCHQSCHRSHVVPPCYISELLSLIRSVTESFTAPRRVLAVLRLALFLYTHSLNHSLPAPNHGVFPLRLLLFAVFHLKNLAFHCIPPSARCPAVKCAVIVDRAASRDACTPCSPPAASLSIRSSWATAPCQSSTTLIRRRFSLCGLSTLASFVTAVSPSSSSSMTSARVGLLASLHFFPSCCKLTVSPGESLRTHELTDPQLNALLGHPTALSCARFYLSGFHRRKAEKVSANGDEQQPEVSVRVTRSKRKYYSLIPSRKRKLDWADIHLPKCHAPLPYAPRSSTICRRCCVSHRSLRAGGVGVSLLLVSVDELSAVFRDPAALPR